MKPTRSSISFQSPFTIGQAIIAVHRDGSDVREITIVKIVAIFVEGGVSVTVHGVQYSYPDQNWFFFAKEDIEEAKEKLVEIKFAKLPNKG